MRERQGWLRLCRDERIEVMVERVTAWLSKGRYALHPWEALGDISEGRCLLTLTDDAVVTGTWWQVVRCQERTYASQLPRRLCGGAERGMSRPRPSPSCVLKTGPERVADGPVEVLRSSIALILADGLGYKTLAGAYFASPAVPVAILDALKSADSGTVQLTNACIVASTVRDDNLWDALAARAREPNDVAEASLREWPHPKAVEYFKSGLRSSERPLIGNSLLFFLLCCDDHGLGTVASVLGDPFSPAPISNRVRQARLQALKAADDLFRHCGREALPEWREYAAAALLVAPVGEENAWIAERGVSVLRRTEDPRCQAVVNRLKTLGVCDSQSGS